MKSCWQGPPRKAPYRALARCLPHAFREAYLAETLDDLRALLEGIRLMRRTAAQTIIRMLTAGLILTLLAGIALKLKLFGEGG